MLALAAAVAAAGCGGGGGGKRLTKSEFIAKADGICAEANKNVPKPPSDLANVDPTAATTTDEQLKKFGDYIDDVVKHLRSELDDLRGIKPPADLQDKYDSGLATLDESLNEISEAADAARDGDREKLKSKLDESDKHSNEANKLAKELGLTVCGSSS
jgi:hypothetical protein